MKKLIPLSFLPALLCGLSLQAQIAFEEIPSNFPDIGYSRNAFADIDGDGDQDAFIAGITPEGAFYRSFFKNDGNGNFTEFTTATNTGFPPVSSYGSDIAFLDLQGDGDLDLVIVGQENITLDYGVDFYINDGNGYFPTLWTTNGEYYKRCAIATGDINEDGLEDVIITGETIGNWSSQVSAAYYQYENDNGDISGMDNNWLLGYTPPATGIIDGDNAIADIDGDGDGDYIVVGPNGMADLYTFDAGQWTLVTGTPFSAAGSAVEFEDVDGDGDQDIFMIGPELYTNDGNGNFTLVTGTPFGEFRLRGSSFAFADVDNDGDQDVLIVGIPSISNYAPPVAKLFTNDGNGNFTEVAGLPFQGVHWSDVDFADIDGDGDQDVLITGDNSDGIAFTKLYRNVTGESLGINQVEQGENQVTMYPNPSMGITNIKATSEISEVVVYDITGRLVKTEKDMNQNAFTLNLKGQSKGLYFVKVKTNGIWSRQKLVLE